MKKKGSSLASLPLFTFSIYTLLSILTLTSNCFLLLSSSTTVIAQKEAQASRKLLVSFISAVEEPGLGRWRYWTAEETNWSQGELRSWSFWVVLNWGNEAGPLNFLHPKSIQLQALPREEAQTWARPLPLAEDNTWRKKEFLKRKLAVSVTHTLSCQQAAWAHQSGAGGRGIWAVCLT